MIEDRALVARFLRHRDERDFRALYRRHSPALYALALRMTPDDADEVMQETWIRATEALPRFQWRSKLRTWLTSIAINCCREQIRRRKRLSDRLSDDGTDAVCDPPRDEGARLDIEQALTRLPDGYRRVLVLYDIYGYTHGEIGEFLGIAEGTCKSQLSRARRAMRAALDGYGPEGLEGIN